jgi:hypothetical protein
MPESAMPMETVGIIVTNARTPRMVTPRGRDARGTLPPVCVLCAPGVGIRANSTLGIAEFPSFGAAIALVCASGLIIRVPQPLQNEASARIDAPHWWQNISSPTREQSLGYRISVLGKSLILPRVVSPPYCIPCRSERAPTVTVVAYHRPLSSTQRPLVGEDACGITGRRCQSPDRLCR